jgi:hypothetical protein
MAARDHGRTFGGDRAGARERRRRDLEVEEQLADEEAHAELYELIAGYATDRPIERLAAERVTGEAA